MWRKSSCYQKITISFKNVLFWLLLWSHQSSHLSLYAIDLVGVDIYCWSFFHYILAAVLKTKFMLDHLSRGPWLMSWCPLKCIGLLNSILLITEIMKKWLDTQNNCVSGSMDFLSASITLHEMVMYPSSMSKFEHTSSTMMTTWSIPAN